MKGNILYLIFTIVIINTTSGQNDYNVANIADSLKIDSDAVLRFYHTKYKKHTDNRYTTTVHYAITVLNPRGKHASALTIYYDRNSEISNIKGFLYNKDGTLQRKLKKKHIDDYAANNYYTLFSDNRVKFFEPASPNYPFTIEFQYTIEKTDLIGIDTWMPQKWFNISVEAAELSFTLPRESDIKHIELNHHFTRKEIITEDHISHIWTAKNLKAIKYQPNIPNYLDFMPAILLSPNEIQYEDTKGDFTTWRSYGKWVYSLIKDRDELPEETIRYIKELTDTIHIKRDKVKAIYKYMQGKTRYVNVALGIGGFQPIWAKDVDKKGYGDCKALSNYTKALLKHAGIDSYYAEIGAGRYQEIKFTDFASANQTNHIILCVPLDSDTLWLECTNSKIPFGYIMPDCQNRYALLIKPRGGELVKTLTFNEKENTRISNIKLEIDKTGYLNFEINTEYNNNLYTEIFPILNISEKEQKEELLKNLTSSKSIEIESFLIQDISGINAKAKLFAKGRLNNSISTSGTRILFAPEFFHNNGFYNFITNNRTLDILEPTGYSYTDTLHISLPEGYYIEYTQNDSQFNSVYGRYWIKMSKYKNTISIVRELTINQGYYDEKTFDEIRLFLDNIFNTENKQIIINKDMSKAKSCN